MPHSQKTVLILKHIWHYLRPSWPILIVAGCSVLISSAAVLMFGQGLRGIVDHGLAGNDTVALNRSFMIMFGIIAVLSLASWGRIFAVSLAGENLIAALRTNLFRHLLTLPPAFFEFTPVGELVSRFSNDITQVQNTIILSFSIALRNILMLLGAAIMLLITSAKLAGLVSLVVPVVVAPLILLGRYVRKLSRLSQDRTAGISAYSSETLDLIKTVQAYTHEPADFAELERRTMATRAANLAGRRVRGILVALLIGLVFSAIAGVLWIGGYDVLAGRLSGGELASFVFYSIVLAGAVAALSDVAGEMQRAAGAMERIMELMATPSSIVPPAAPKPLPARIEAGKPIIQFAHVEFQYPSRPNQDALADFSLDVMPGERIGIVGPSGAGKTTVFQLLLRFYDAGRGQILVSGVPIREASLADLRRRIALVPQEPAIFSASLLDNVRYGRPDASREEVLEACRLAKVDEFIPFLPSGIDTYLGERGARLSGGQKQRIGIARAILRNPDILLLDEATSQLDSENEKLVQAAIENLSKGRTTITIAHRLSTLRDADRIVVLDRGHCLGIGRHDELMNDNPVYKNLVSLQKAA